MYGIDKEDIASIIKVFSSFNNIEKAVLYGSRAKGNYRPSSDIDISLFASNLSLDEFLEIEILLDDLLLPYDIDLSLYHKIQNKALTEHINRVGIIIHKQN